MDRGVKKAIIVDPIGGAEDHHGWKLTQYGYGDGDNGDDDDIDGSWSEEGNYHRGYGEEEEEAKNPIIADWI